MSNSLVSKLVYALRSRIRFARYSQAIRSQTIRNQTINPFQSNPHPVTLGPEQISRFFTYVANSERARF
jgi:hypothetical protein